jgi:hypothetical protein
MRCNLGQDFLNMMPDVITKVFEKARFRGPLIDPCYDPPEKVHLRSIEWLHRMEQVVQLTEKVEDELLVGLSA